MVKREHRLWTALVEKTKFAINPVGHPCPVVNPIRLEKSKPRKNAQPAFDPRNETSGAGDP